MRREGDPASEKGPGGPEVASRDAGRASAGSEPVATEPDGIIKFRCDWERELVEVDRTLLSEINRVRTSLVAEGLIGVLPDGIGFGNLSIRFGDPGLSSDVPFLITGSGTGARTKLTASDLSAVTSFDLAGNRLQCRGLTKASSESMSHGAIYSARAEIMAVLHIHSAPLWEALYQLIPTTPPSAEYGTPELALSLENLVLDRAIELPATLLLGGHRDGLIFAGKDLDQASAEALRLARSL